MKIEISEDVRLILDKYDPTEPRSTAESLRQLWLGYEPKSMGGIKAEQRALQEMVGTPVAVLKAIGNEIGNPVRKQVITFIPLAQLLWNEYGREGRVVATPLLGKMELFEPDTVLPLLMELCRSCHTWEDADQLAMNALEPVVRKDPGEWLQAMDSWLADENKWVRRAGVTVVGRLPMKRSDYTERCLAMIERLLLDQETDVKRAVSFAIRISARGSVEAVREFLARHVPPKDPATTWVLCDAIRSMTKRTLPELISLIPQYEQWAAIPGLSGKDRRSVESALRILKSAQN